VGVIFDGVSLDLRKNRHEIYARLAVTSISNSGRPTLDVEVSNPRHTEELNGFLVAVRLRGVVQLPLTGTALRKGGRHVRIVSNPLCATERNASWMSARLS
jgi:hypothetical protein